MVQKYRNKITYVSGIRFDSRKEAMRFLILKDKLEAGLISDLQRQVRYELLPAIKEEVEVVKELKTKTKIIKRTKTIQQPVYYYADFVYTDNKTGRQIVEDVKGGNITKTKEYMLKKKMMRALKNITITEV